MTSSIKPEVHNVFLRTPPEEARATAIGNVHEKFGEDRICSSEDMIADRQTHRDTQTDTLITILRSPIAGGVIKMAQQWTGVVTTTGGEDNYYR